mmetsp:Transcript_126584/g.219338  ORF Transcript_126584/g.219338 Transcript_126584/m.219338 type:complete len:282 (-) Transcript_126584:867-1712(-)
MFSAYQAMASRKPNLATRWVGKARGKARCGTMTTCQCANVVTCCRPTRNSVLDVGPPMIYLQTAARARARARAKATVARARVMAIRAKGKGRAKAMTIKEYMLAVARDGGTKIKTRIRDTSRNTRPGRTGKMVLDILQAAAVVVVVTVGFTAMSTPTSHYLQQHSLSNLVDAKADSSSSSSSSAVGAHLCAFLVQLSCQKSASSALFVGQSKSELPSLLLLIKTYAAKMCFPLLSACSILVTESQGIHVLTVVSAWFVPMYVSNIHWQMLSSGPRRNIDGG